MYFLHSIINQPTPGADTGASMASTRPGLARSAHDPLHDSHDARLAGSHVAPHTCRVQLAVQPYSVHDTTLECQVPASSSSEYPSMVSVYYYMLIKFVLYFCETCIKHRLDLQTFGRTLIYTLAQDYSFNFLIKFWTSF